MTSISTPQETPNQPASTIVFTSGSTARIDASAEAVFSIITAPAEYGRWNSWTPIFEFEGPMQKGSDGVLTAKQEGKEYRIPLQIIAYSSNTDQHILAWRAALLPAWFAVAERVHIVTPLEDGRACEVRQWESMSGWGAYILKYLMGVPAQLEAANLTYIKELKDYAETSTQ